MAIKGFNGKRAITVIISIVSALVVAFILWLVGAFKERLTEFDQQAIASEIVQKGSFKQWLINSLKQDESFRGKEGPQGPSGPQGPVGPQGPGRRLKITVTQYIDMNRQVGECWEYKKVLTTDLSNVCAVIGTGGAFEGGGEQFRIEQESSAWVFIGSSCQPDVHAHVICFKIE
jgi:hypothetical protein